jgi:hypothetical protein
LSSFPSYTSFQVACHPLSPFIEKRGGHPQHLLPDAPPDLSERVNRKQAIADHPTVPMSSKMS